MSGRGGNQEDDRGLEESVSVILMAILVIAVAAIIASIVFGLITFYPKSAYIVVKTESKNVSPDNWYLSVFHANGDNAYINNSLAGEGMPVDFQFTTPQGLLVYPLPDGPITWKPGDTLFVYNKSGLLSVTKNESLARKASTGLPTGTWRFDVVDVTDHVLVYSSGTAVGNVTLTSTPTVSPTATATTANTTVPTTNVTTPVTTTVTTTVTTANTTVPTTNVTTPVTTTVTTTVTTSATRTITVSWHPPGQGNITPPGTVTVPYGSDQPFTITATKKKGISSIIVDGVDLGIQPDSPYVYTFYNVVTSHTLYVEFSN